MLTIKKRYVVNDENKPVAVQVDIATWTKIEEMLEDHLFVKKMQEAEREAPLDRDAALKYYAKQRKTR